MEEFHSSSDQQNFGQCYLRKNGKYYDKYTNKIINDSELLNQIKKVKIPQTYTNVLICPDPRNNLAGMATDKVGQTQYFYTDKHKINATRSKNCNLIYFGKIYEEIISDLDHVLKSNSDDIYLLIHALALRIMTLCHFRPGCERHLKDNGTYGLTNIQWKHYSKLGEIVKISFKGKKNQINTCIIRDPLTINLLDKLNDQNNEDTELLNYEGIDVTPRSLNLFLQKYHPSITTKTWRTWFANQSYIEKINQLGIVPDTIRTRKILSNRILRTIAEELHHTLSVNKRNYLIPELEELFIKDPDEWEKLTIITNNSKDFLLDFLKNYCES